MTQQLQNREPRTDIERMTGLCELLATPGSVIPSRADIELADALSRRDFDPMKLLIAGRQLLLSNAQVRSFLESAWTGDVATLDQFLANGTLIGFYSTPLMLALLKTTPIPDLHFERLTTHIRMRLLECAADPGWQPDRTTLQATAAIAIHAFLTDYILLETERETQLINALQERLLVQQEPGSSHFDLAVLGAYRPLHEVFSQNRLSLDAPEPIMADLLRVQVEEPAREKALMDEIPTVTVIEDSVSAAVQEQYEEHPYPRWVSSIYNDPVTPDELFLSACTGVDIEAFGVRDTYSLLFAGCGTGKVVAEESVLWLNAEILAFDLSRSSLAYGARRTEELGIKSASFAQGDLLELPKLGKSFDYISCGGVLHHMADPIAGWQALTDVCRPGGVMRVCLYSELAREPVRYALSVIGDQREGADTAAIKAIRQSLVENIVGSASPDSKLSEVFNALDMYTTSMCRDLLFHVHEQDFTIPRLAAAIEQIGVRFCGFVDPERRLLTKYRAFAPHDPDGLDLASWHRFEVSNPSAFAQMYDVMVQKPL